MNRIPKVHMRAAHAVRVGDRVWIDERFWLVNDVMEYSTLINLSGQLGSIWCGDRNTQLKVKR